MTLAIATSMAASDAAIAALRAMVRDARRIAAFTGAGISTECGVPDFRSPGSPWLRHPPVGFAAFLADPAMRAEAWRRKFAMDDLYAGAQPGRGHMALAALVRQGRCPAVITQNIDGLHQASGLSGEEVIELHGNGTYAACLDCGRRHELRDVRAAFEASGEAPRCPCGGMVKSATIAFGQAMPQEPLRRARDLCERCDLMLVAGSSLLVRPAALLPLLAVRRGARLAILNREATPLDEAADLVVRGDIGTVLSRLGP